MAAVNQLCIQNLRSSTNSPKAPLCTQRGAFLLRLRMEKCGALAWCTNKKWQADFLLFCTECRGNSVRTGEEDWMNAQKQAVKTVKNADFCSKRHGKIDVFGRNRNAREKKARCGMRTGHCREMYGKRQFFRWKKIILVDSRPRICYNKLQILYCIRRAAR